MAKPRVFISSTFYDLRQVREDLERFVREIGYEPVRNETGSIPYSRDESPESSAYREIELCDIIVSIIGGRFGTESREEPEFSVSQKELKRAIERGVQVFIFIEKSVHSEFSTYVVNKGNDTTKYRFVDDARVFEFIESLEKLRKNNPIAPFETSADIVEYLRAQWAGLFQRFLREQKLLSELRILGEMKSTVATLRELVTFLTEERRSKDDAIKHILLANHPVFRRFAQLTDTTYRVFFADRSELQAWLSARGWSPVDVDGLDSDSVMEWGHSKRDGYIKLTHDIFDEDGRLLPFSEDEWDDDWLAEGTETIDEDDLPF